MENKKILTTLCLIYQHPQVLLGMKKRGFGAGRWNGFGGKVSPGETVEEAAVRETREEIGIKVGGLNKIGIIKFEFQNNPEFIEMHIFHSSDFRGNPEESEEMKPQWFNVNEIPYETMWAADRHWFPLFLAGKRFRGRFFYNNPASDVILEKTLEEIL